VVKWFEAGILSKQHSCRPQKKRPPMCLLRSRLARFTTKNKKKMVLVWVNIARTFLITNLQNIPGLFFIFHMRNEFPKRET